MTIWMMYTIIFIATTGIAGSFVLILRYRPLIRGSRPVSLRHFALLVNAYLTVILAFALIYIVLEMLNITVLSEGNSHVGGMFSHLIEDAIYFSAVTMLSVGYGDIVPIGIGRVIAVVQALFGFLLPAAFVVTTISNKENSRE